MEDFPEIPGYRIVSELGSGAVAIVYLGIQENLERKVAIKVMEETTLQKNKEISKRFVREAKTAASLSHSNIIQIFDAGKVGRYFYIVMEFLEESLRDKLMRSPKYKLVPDIAVDIAADVMRALDYAHLRGIYHRDIKPDNIMFRQDGTPVLLDFGIARIFDPHEDLTKSKMSMGTTYYMSPEQCRAQKDLDGRSDVYSLGVVLFEMLSGEKPYKGETSGIITSQHLDKPVPSLPEELSVYQPLIDKMMAKNREKRISSRPEFIQLLEDIPRSPIGSSSTYLESPHLPDPPPSLSQDTDVTTSTPLYSPRYSTFKFSVISIKSISKRSLDFFKEKFPLFLHYPWWKKLVLGLLPLMVVAVLTYILFFYPGKASTRNEFSSPSGELPPTMVQGDEPVNQDSNVQLRKKLDSANQHFIKGLEILKEIESSKDSREIEELKRKINQKKDAEFNKYDTYARLYYDDKNYQKAKENIFLAKQIKTTPELLSLEKDINFQLEELEKNQKQIEKDDQTYALAVSKNTIDNYRSYLVEFPDGRHCEEITQILKKLKQDTEQQEKIKLRSEYKTLGKNDIEDMIKRYDFFDNIMNEFGNYQSEYKNTMIGISSLIIDQKADLMWYDGESPEKMTFKEAENWLKKLNENGYAGFSDWRFPTLEEGASLLRGEKNNAGMHIHPAFSGNQSIIWTGDSYKGNGLWVVLFYPGLVELSINYKESQVRPVRSIE